MTYFDWRPYVPVGARRAQAVRELEKLRKKGQDISPVLIEGRTIAKTFWGRAWCENLEGYSDYANRLPRGRTYVRNGSVVHLSVAAGRVDAFVSGSSLYTVRVKVAPVPRPRWSAICKDCGGAIDSLVELLQGRFSNGVMERLCQRTTGLFPSPKEIDLSCSCPDSASMCKHVAAVLYGIGGRLDDQPRLLFALRAVDENDLIARVGKDLPLARKRPASCRVLDAGDMSEIFGLEMADAGSTRKARRARDAGSARTAPKSGAAGPRDGSPKVAKVHSRAGGASRAKLVRRRARKRATVTSRIDPEDPSPSPG